MMSNIEKNIVGGFAVLIALFLLFVMGSALFEPANKISCSNATIVDMYRDQDDSNIIVLDAGSSVEKLSTTNEDYYRHVVGEVVEMCYYEKAWSHFPDGYRLGE